jgi:hypothetical protein
MLLGIAIAIVVLALVAVAVRRSRRNRGTTASGRYLNRVAGEAGARSKGEEPAWNDGLSGADRAGPGTGGPGT